MIKRRRPPSQIAEASKFDSLNLTDLYLALETSLSKTTQLMSTLPRSSTQEFDLIEMESAMETATMACRSLRRRVAS